MAPLSRRQRKRKQTFYLVSGLLALTALVLLVLLIDNLANPQTTQSDRKSSSANTERTADAGAIAPPGTVTPAPSPTTSTAPTATEPSPFGPTAANYLNSRLGRATAAVYDVATGQTWFLHPGDQQDTASIVKVDIMETLMDQSTTSGQPISPGDQSLLSSMIVVSDNDAATTLWNEVGGPTAIAKFNTSIGMDQTTPSSCLTCAGFPWPGWGLTTTTAADQLTLLRHLILPNTEIADSDRTAALNLLENVTPSERWGVSNGVPAQATVALKNGWVPLNSTDTNWQIDSIGWISGLDRNYLIAILSTSNPSEEYGIETIDSISSMVWSALG